jgi:hypothetical protein
MSAAVAEVSRTLRVPRHTFCGVVTRNGNWSAEIEAIRVRYCIRRHQVFVMHFLLNDIELLEPSLIVPHHEMMVKVCDRSKWHIFTAEGIVLFSLAM